MRKSQEISIYILSRGDRESVMFKRMAILGALLCAANSTSADALASGSVTKISVSNGVIGVFISTDGASVCPAGWFYAYDSESNTTAVSRLLSTLMLAKSQGVSVSLYANPTVVCGTSHFLAVTSN